MRIRSRKAIRGSTNFAENEDTLYKKYWKDWNGIRTAMLGNMYTVYCGIVNSTENPEFT